METIEAKMNEYFDWLKTNYKYKKLEGTTEITTPFKNPLNDYIRIYADLSPHNQMQLSDDGLTLSELEMHGIDIKTKTRMKLFKSILNQFNLFLNGDEIITNVKQDSFAQSKHNLIQGILKIYDLTMTVKSNVSNLFYEEVYKFLYDEEVRGTANVAVAGQSGIKYTLDYIVPGDKIHPETLLNFANNLDFNKMTSDAFAFRDIKHNRPKRNHLDTQMMIIANDIENSVPQRVYQAANYEGIRILSWANKTQIKSILT
ncbi:uncharacterized protein DUF1828/uncharacterized protein DUF1829 [Staphylococcus auricularis]|uniref:DUF1828 domain-containing protein n=1 Tax=Staphylococcus auricularis TaxID=29379 RepID=A0AAP8TT88_9STAP|nr:DUF1828 domain-containing protein [Staphylococcus auricularis]MBM0868726.1 DUF1828 domain-containing protein [Staphylococcus auricularis]MCG7342491.1 DUF1828 domain-containing protein [Staphylococcus auricularis]MDC6326228.1 DUF1828 domain-containing protein [Staphylococcus auricularis]MDN4533881.1 DUF1828 domain-containing protein [Staphylococcus auricularis]PNZ67729.1 DUF1828 domain-containing protein [Staphylococcus auricularis]